MLEISESKGVKKLKHYCKEIEDYLFESDKNIKIECETKLGCLYDCTLMPSPINRSYNLYVKIYGSPFIAIHYQLDSSYSLDVSKKEVERIEDMLADKAISILSIFGAAPLIQNRITNDKIKIYIFKESERSL